jgi:hypothetical protein
VSDFLSRLVGRTVGMTDGIRPRIAPLFAGSPALVSEMPSEDDVRRDLPVARARQHISRPAARSEEVPGTSPVTEPPAEERPLKSSASARTSGRTSATGSRVVASDSATAEVETSNRPESVATRAAQQTHHDIPGDAYTPLIPLEIGSERSNEAQRPIRSLIGPLPTGEVSPVLRFDDDARPTTKRQREEPSPEIRVTIGRIDVRAVQPAAPVPAPPPRPAPHLTLDDYIQQRKQGLR